MSDFKYSIRCQLCGHTIETNCIEGSICDDCGYDKFDIIYDSSRDVIIDEPIKIEEPKNSIVYLITKDGGTMVVMKNSRIQYSLIDHIRPEMRRYTYGGAMAARDVMKKRHPDWNLKVKTFK